MVFCLPTTGSREESREIFHGFVAIMRRLEARILLPIHVMKCENEKYSKNQR